MASLIKVRTISAATETAIQMANSTFARLIGIGTSWTEVRVGIRWHTDTIGATVTAPRFALGFCSGTTNQFGDTTTTHFVGAASSGANWTDEGSGTYYTVPLVPAKRVGSTLTTGTALGTGRFGNRAATNVADRGVLFVDLFKGSPNFTIRAFAGNDGVNLDVSAATFLIQMEAISPAITGHTYFAGQTIAVNEGTDGTLDSINVSWDKTTPFIELCDIAVAILA